MAEQIKHFVSGNYGPKGLVNFIPIIKNLRPNVKLMNETEPQDLPSEEPIDLRDLFPEKCFPLQQGDLVHFLDAAAERFYKKQLRLNNGHYTQSVYVDVLKHAAARLSGGQSNAANEEENASFKPPVVIPVGYSQYRQEQRLNFATDIEIELPSGSIIHGRSVDISSSGIQIKLRHLVDVIDGMEMEICFPALEEKYERTFGLISYRLMKSEIGTVFMTLKLVRVNPGSHPFDVFLQNFIDSKKHRYRIDAEDSKLALTAKAWEYLYIKALPYIAGFVATTGERIQIQEIAVSDRNKQQIKGLGNSMLSLIEQTMSSLRLKAVANNDSPPPEIYAYRYQGTGLRRRLGATSWQFTDDESRFNFLRVGVAQSTFAAWRIHVIKLTNMPEQRSNELLDKLAKDNPEQAKNLVEQLNHYDFLIYLVDISKIIRQDPLLKHDEFTEAPDDYFFDDYEIKRERSAEHTRLRLGISKQRNEERYIYQTPIVLKFYGESIKGHTLDLSVNGLKVILNKPQDLQIRETVTIDFVGFNKKFRSSKLKGQSYRIAAIAKDGALCLTRDHRIARHEAAIFMNKLITKNKDILPSCTGELWMSTKSRLIESWLNLCLPTQALLMTRNNGVYEIPFILSGDYTAQLLAPFQIGQDIYNFDPIVTFQPLKDKIRTLTVNTQRTLSMEIYITQSEAIGNDLPIIEIKTWSDFKDDIQRVDYLQKCCRAPVFGLYNVALCKVPRLIKSELIADMNIIRRNARHRLEEFDREYQSLAVIIELSDARDMILNRYGIRSI